MENNREYHIGRTDFDAFVHAVGSEIEQAQVRLITAANAQMLFHYWKMGYNRKPFFFFGGRLCVSFADWACLFLSVCFCKYSFKSLHPL